MSVIVKNPDLCPELATPSIVITKDNVEALKLSNYSRTHGTIVSVSCLAHPEYRLVGANVLTCLSTGQWDKEKPYCRMGEDTSGGVYDISMIPALVTAGSLAVVLFAAVCIMFFVLCCWKQTVLRRRTQKSPIGLFRSLSVQEAESVFNQRRHHYYPASECSDVIDSVSTRCPPHTHIHSPEVLARDPYTYNNIRSFRGAHAPSMLSMDQSESVSRSPPTTYFTALSRDTGPPLKTRVGTRQSYRTWHELFYNAND